MAVETPPYSSRRHVGWPFVIFQRRPLKNLHDLPYHRENPIRSFQPLALISNIPLRMQGDVCLVI